MNTPLKILIKIVLLTTIMFIINIGAVTFLVSIYIIYSIYKFIRIVSDEPK
jgi:hypothetical protein